MSAMLGPCADDGRPPAVRNPGYRSFVEEIPAWDMLVEDGLPRYPRRPPRDVA